MSAAAFLRRFGRDRRGAGAAEFALVLPLSILFLVGLLDTGRLFYDINRGEKATQIGARWAVVTDPLAPELASTSYVGFVTPGGVTVNQGDRIPADALGLVECTQDGCKCDAAPVWAMPAIPTAWTFRHWSRFESTASISRPSSCSGWTSTCRTSRTR